MFRFENGLFHLAAVFASCRFAFTVAAVSFLYIGDHQQSAMFLLLAEALRYMRAVLLSYLSDAY